MSYGKTKEKNEFGLKLEKYLKDNDISKEKFAASIGVSRNQLWMYETDQAVIPLKVKLSIMFTTLKKINFPEVK